MNVTELRIWAANRGDITIRHAKNFYECWGCCRLIEANQFYGDGGGKRKYCAECCETMASRVAVCACGHDYAQHSKGPASADYCRHCPCPEWRAAGSGDGSKK
jgi:hypothetical protein